MFSKKTEVLLNHPSVMYKKSAVIEAGFYEDYRFFEDYNLWCTMLNKGYKGYNVKEISCICVVAVKCTRDVAVFLM